MRSLCILTALIAACASGPLRTGEKPAWVDKPADDPRYPADKFLCAVGTTTVGAKAAPDLLAALDASARASLAATLQSTVSAEVKSVERVEQTVNGKEHSTVESFIGEQRVQQVVKEFDLSAAVTIVDRFREGDLASAWAVLDKAKALGLQEGKVKDHARLAQELVAQGDAAAGPGDALRAYARARSESEAAQGGAMLLRALGGKAEAPAAVAEGKLAALLGKLALTLADGDAQRVSEGKPLPQPLVLTALIDGKPAAGLPLTAQVAGTKDVEGTVGPDGRATLRIDDAGKFAEPQKSVAISVDWGRLVGGPSPAWARGAGRTVSATLVKRSIATTRVLLLISEKVEGEAQVSEPPVQAQLGRLLQRAGFSLQSSSALNATELSALSDPQLRERTRAIADVVIVGNATSRFSSNFGNTTVWHRARADLRALDLGTGLVLFQAPATEVKGKPGAPSVAGRSALEALGEAIGPGLAQSLTSAVAQ